MGIMMDGQKSSTAIFARSCSEHVSRVSGSSRPIWNSWILYGYKFRTLHMMCRTLQYGISNVREIVGTQTVVWSDSLLASTIAVATSSTMMVLIFFLPFLGSCCYISARVLTCFHLMKGRASYFRHETLVASFLHHMVLLSKVLLNHSRKKQFVVLH